MDHSVVENIGYDICITITCSESKPQECHRSRQVINILVVGGVTIGHIDETGIIKEYDILIGKVYKYNMGIYLFDNVINGTSIKTQIKMSV